MATYTFKSTEPDIVEFLEGSTNKSETIKEALRLKKLHDLNPNPQIPQMTNLRVKS